MKMCNNVLLIICHDLGKHLGCYGVDSVCTPNLNKLSQEGVIFENAFSVAPQCSPSRAALYTGRWPHANGVLGLTHGTHGWDLNEGERHLATFFKKAGYHTAVIGMQHETRRINQMGYEYIDLLEPCRLNSTTERAIEFLESQTKNEKPFFAQVGFWEPHRPFDTGGIKPDSHKVYIPPFIKNESSSRRDFAAYQGAIKAMDACVGKILNKLELLKLKDNTLVIFTTDHGMPFPLAKCTLYDPGLEISLIMRWPNKNWIGGKRHNQLISNIDIFPTMLDILKIPHPFNIHGKSFFDLLEEKTYHERNEIFGEMTYHSYYDPMRCIRTKRHKLIVFFSQAPFFMTPTQSYHPLSEDATDKKWPNQSHKNIELYDLRKESWEKTNIADYPRHKNIKNELMVKLYDWMQKTEDPLLTGIPPSPMHNVTIKILKEATSEKRESK